jgi:cation diffusion facilitator family transporter
MSIQLNEALMVACIGLAVNLLSAWLLRGHDHGHHHGHQHHAHHCEGDHHDHGHRISHARESDGNYRAALAHVVADAVTSALAIGALIAAGAFGWTWIDPLVGIIGAALIAAWATSLMRASSSVLLDALPSDDIGAAVRGILETSDDRVSDLHVWQLGPGHMGVIVSIVTHDPQSPDHYKAKLKSIPRLSHLTVEVLRCPSHTAVLA